MKILRYVCDQENHFPIKPDKKNKWIKRQGDKTDKQTRGETANRTNGDMEKWINRQKGKNQRDVGTNGQNTNIQTYKHTNKQTNIHTYIHTNIQTYKHTNIQTYKHTNIQTYKQGDIY